MVYISWILQIIIAVIFIPSGWEKIVGYFKQKGSTDSPKPTSLLQSPGFFFFIGICEFLGGWGVMLPNLFGILPILTILAAIGLIIIMIGATQLNLKMHKTPMVAYTISLIVAMIIIIIFRSLTSF